MSKPSRGTTRSSVGKKKAKKRPESRPVSEVAANGATGAPAQPREVAEERSAGSVLQFRPRGREAGAGRPGGRGIAPARAVLQAIDYSYVFTDLRIIGVLALVLFGALIALSFVLR